MLHRPHHTLGIHEVHVWYLFADHLRHRQTRAALLALLSPEEQDRMTCYRHESDRTLYLLARGLTRSVLASYLGCLCRDVRFAASDFGKPILHTDCYPAANARGPEKLYFNLTHSRGAVALAVSNGREVGIDIEQRGRLVEFLPLAERFFSASEANYLKELPAEKLGEAFFAVWTLKEAFVKGIGRGLSFPLDAFCFDLEGDRFLRFRPLADDVSPDWHFQQFDLGERHRGAVAVQGDHAQVELRDWAAAFM